jgi:hypothetical protein
VPRESARCHNPPHLFWQIVGRAPEWLRPSFVTMVVTGTGPAEFLRLEATDLHPLTFSVTVFTARSSVARVAKPAASPRPDDLDDRRYTKHRDKGANARRLGALLFGSPAESPAVTSKATRSGPA